MGIVNATPDSFSDGGRWTQLPQLVESVAAWTSLGLDVVDVGGESTRPGGAPVDPAEERRRVIPVIDALRGDPRTADTVVSVDTRHSSTARAAVAAGADIVNDVSGLADPAMARVVAELGAALVIGHMRGTPTTMMRDVSFDAPFDDVAAALERSVAAALAAGVPEDAIVVDPCLGFGKSATHSAAWLHWPSRLRRRLGHAVLIGASRKRFIQDAIGRDEPAASRLAGSVAAAVVAMQRGASVVRVHDVRETLDARAVLDAVERGASGGGIAGDDAPVGDAPDVVDAIAGWVRRLRGSGHGGLLILEGDTPVLPLAVAPGGPAGSEGAPGLALRRGGPREPELDGALVVAGSRAARARLTRQGLVCPLWAGALPGDGEPAGGLGLRHRAALGISSRSDAMVIVVSQSRGETRVAVGDRLVGPVGERGLVAQLHRWLSPDRPRGTAAPATQSR